MSEVKLIVDGVEIGEVQRLSLKQGDIVIVSIDSILPESEGERIRNKIKSFLARLGHENEVIVMDGGLRLELIR